MRLACLRKSRSAGQCCIAQEKASDRTSQRIMLAKVARRPNRAKLGGFAPIGRVIGISRPGSRMKVRLRNTFGERGAHNSPPTPYFFAPPPQKLFFGARRQYSGWARRCRDL